MSNVTLTLNGQSYGGWESVTINRGIKQLCGDFTLSASDRWPGNWAAQPIKPGSACTVSIDGETVITGYVGRSNPRFDDSDHLVSIRGRDKSADLVDCSAIHKSGHWRGVGVLQIVQDLAAPFGVKVIAAADPGAPFRDFAIQEGETAFETLSRAAAMRGLLAVSDSSGVIVLTRTGSSRHAVDLIEGVNIKAAEGDYSIDERFSVYMTKGQRRGTDDDTGAPELLSGPSGSVTDDGVPRYRPMIILAEDQGDGVTFQQRAQWERNVRRGQGKVARVTLRGWREFGDRGDLWQPNRTVRIVSPKLWLDEILLISGVSYSKSAERGTVADLELTDPLAFDLPPGGKA